MDVVQIFQQYGHLVFGVVLLFGGVWGIKYFNLFRRKAHNFLLFATVFGVLFIVVELAIGAFHKEQLVSILLTYCVVTSMYELFLKRVLGKIIGKNDE